MFCTSLNSDWSVWLCPVLLPFLAWTEGGERLLILTFRTQSLWPVTGTQVPQTCWKITCFNTCEPQLKAKEFSSHARVSLHLHNTQKTFSWKMQYGTTTGEVLPGTEFQLSFYWATVMLCADLGQLPTQLLPPSLLKRIGGEKIRWEVCGLR